MIFVTVGTHRQGFERLIKKMDEIAAKIDEKVIIQIGYSKYLPIHAEHFKFADFSTIKEYNKKARIVISHAGAGSILTAIEQKVPIIIVPRSKKYGEHNDDHQLEIASAFENHSNIFVVYEIDRLDDYLHKQFIGEYEENKNKTLLINYLKNYIESLNN